MSLSNLLLQPQLTMTASNKQTGHTRDGSWHTSTKGYPRYHSGPYRNQYVHRVVMARKLGRPLRKDEDIHHRDGNKLNFAPSNLRLLDHTDHGYISAKQHWFVKNRLNREEAGWYEEYQANDATQFNPQDWS